MFSKPAGPVKLGLLSAGKKQMIQIAKALYLNARVISFDEPTSSLSTASPVPFSFCPEEHPSGVHRPASYSELLSVPE